MKMENESRNVTDGGVGPSYHEHGQDASTQKAQRDYEKCIACRINRKKCRRDEKDPFRCKRCVKGNWPCSPRGRAPARPYYQPTSDEYSASITVALMLLSICRDSCWQFFSIIYPWPCANIFGEAASFRSRSRTLSDGGLRPLASRLHMQIRLIDAVISRLQYCQLSTWTKTFISELQQNLSYHPSHSSGPSAETSSRNAADIAACAKYSLGYGYAADLSSQHSQRQFLEAYLKAQSNLRDLLQSGFFVIVDEMKNLICIEDAFPAAHIAYLNRDPSAAFELWKQCRDATDILGRKLAHLVAEEGDLGMMQAMDCIDNQAWRDSSRDKRGFSVLEIVVCKGHATCLEYLIERRFRNLQQCCIEVDLFDLALASGNRPVVEAIERSQFALPPYNMHAVKAIELGRADLVCCLLPSLFNSCWIQQGEIEQLIERAKQKEEDLRLEVATAVACGFAKLGSELEERRFAMEELISGLERRKVVQVAAGDTIASLQALPLGGGAR